MTKREMFERNQQLSAEFDLYLLDHPDIADQIPDGVLPQMLTARFFDSSGTPSRIHFFTRRR
jgi:hypothetical protein